MSAAEAKNRESLLISNGTSNGHIKGINETTGKEPLTEFSLHGFQHYEKRRAFSWPIWSLISSAIFIIIIVVLTAVLISEKSKKLLCPRTGLVHSCPDGWIGYQGRCYYFASAEADWESSRQNCSAFNASLAVIDSREEMAFLRRYKTFADHWIGLQRNEETEPWKWINGTLFNNTFRILGSGKCAYMNHEGIASSSCVREEPWICSKPPVRQSDGPCTCL